MPPLHRREDVVQGVRELRQPHGEHVLPLPGQDDVVPLRLRGTSSWASMASTSGFTAATKGCSLTSRPPRSRCPAPNGGLAGSTVLTRKKDNFLNRDFKPGFRIDLHHKDMGIVTDAARNVGAALPVGAVVAQLVASLRAQGDGGLDHSALLRAVERLSGQQV
ncbi:2-hydroxy-3-oxopropionate reductase [Streptomyces tanashiensis]